MGRFVDGVGEFSFRRLEPRGQPKVIAAIHSLEVYADESGIASGAKHCVVAGLVGGDEHWRRAENAWRKACGGIVFHALEFFDRDGSGQRTGHYSGWSDERAKDFIHALFDAIEKNYLTLIGASIDVAAFNALSDGERRYLTLAPFNRARRVWKGTGAPSKPWFIGFTQCLVTGAHYAIERAGKIAPADAKCHYWFDRQNVFESFANEMFQRACSPDAEQTVSERLGGLLFMPKDDYPGLQAADLVCFTGSSFLQRGRPKSRDHAIAVERMKSLSRQRFVRWDAKRMRTHIDSVPAEIRQMWDTAKLRGDKRRKSS